MELTQHEKDIVDFVNDQLAYERSQTKFWKDSYDAAMKRNAEIETLKWKYYEMSLGLN